MFWDHFWFSMQKMPYTCSGWYIYKETKAGLGREKSWVTPDLG